MTVIAAERMAERFTVPFARGADVLRLEFAAGATATTGSIAPYDFAEHVARFSVYRPSTQPAEPRAPRYVFMARRDLDAATELTVAWQTVPPAPAANGTATLDVPAGTRAGTSFSLDLAATALTRLRTVTSSPSVATGTLDEQWTIVALLGNTAKLVWAAGSEKDALRAYYDQVREQNLLRLASGETLELFGFDLRVQRFPPLPYAFEENTVALYHLDDRPAPPATEVPAASNAMELYGGAPHPATNVVTGPGPRAASGAAGRFGGGFLFRDDDAELRVANHADFTVAAGSDFTAECFVNPDDVATEGHVLTKHTDVADGNAAGWALSVGDFGRQITRNVRFLVGDGTTGQSVFLDETLAPGRFYHLAGVVDRAADEVRLYVDGRLRDEKDIAAVGALTNSEPVRIGKTAAAPFKGVIDEVRLSRSARRAFHPVLGESDESYRRRLLVFERWTLPTPANLVKALNDVAGPIGGDSEPFVVEERDAPVVAASRTITILPTEIGVNQHIAANGDRRVLEASVSGVPGLETQFDPAFLVLHSGAAYAPPPPRDLRPGEPPPDPRRMQFATAGALDRLVAVAGAGVRVERGFDPRADDLRVVGRALHLTHGGMPLRRLAALAHRAGFSWVLHDARAGHVHASVALADYLAIEITQGTPTTSTGFDLLVGEQIELTAQPNLATVSPLYQWSTIACGAGRAEFSKDARGDPIVARRTATIEATAPGELRVQVEVTIGQRLFTTTRTFRVGLAQLGPAQSVDDRGRRGVDEKIGGTPDDDALRPASLLASYLVTFADPRASFATLADRRMQPAVAARLTRTLDLLDATVGGGPLQVSQSITSLAGLEPVGRSLTLQHPAGAGPLGALCHGAGFTYVRRQGNRILVLQSAGGLSSIDSTPPGTTELDEGDSARMSVRPRATPTGLALSGPDAYVANSGTDTVTRIEAATGRVRAVYKVGWEPVAVAAAPTSNTRAYTADRAGQSITSLDLAAGNVVGQVAVPARPVALAHHPTAPSLYAALEDGRLTELDTSGAALSVVNTVSLAAPATPVPRAIGLTPNGGEAWVALDSAEIAVVDTASFTVSATVTLPGPPQDLALDATQAYVTLPGQGEIVIVDVASRAVGPPIAVGAAPGPIAIAPGSTKIYVADSEDGRLYLREPNGDPDRRFPVGRSAVDVVAAPNRVYVVTSSEPAAAPGAAVGADGVTVVDASATVPDVIAGWTLGTGLGETLIWTLALGEATEARLSSTTASEVELMAERAGPMGVQAVYIADALPPPAPRTNAPYTFAVRLKDALQDDPNVVIRKEQYDLVMNVLNAFHPVGVEVATQAIREKVIEVREELMEVFPAYTFPEFRVRGPNPALERRRQQEAERRRLEEAERRRQEAEARRE